MRILSQFVFLVAPVEYFDPAALPTVTLEDVAMFHDAILAIQHDASACAIGQYLAHLESRWWDMAGRQHEYDREVRRLRWVQRCWNRLEAAYSLYGEIERTAALDELRRLLGPQAFYAGRMPDYPDGARPWTLPRPKDVK